MKFIFRKYLFVIHYKNEWELIFTWFNPHTEKILIRLDYYSYTYAKKTFEWLIFMQKVTQFKCSECPLIYFTKTKLNKHIKLEHR